MLGIGIIKMFGGGTAGGGGGGGVGGINLNNSYIYGVTNGQWTANTDGFVYENTTQVYTWKSPQSGMNLYDIRATLVSGQIPPGPALGSWWNLGTTRTWGWSSTMRAKNSVIKVEIRLTSTGAILDDGTITFEIDGEDFSGLE